MAEVITRLKIDGQDYDNKLKRAIQGLQHYADAVRKADGDLRTAHKDAQSFFSTIGQMATDATSSKEKLTELTQAYTDLSLVWQNMSKIEKNGKFGKTLEMQMGQIKGRITELSGQINKAKGELVSFEGFAQKLAEKVGISTTAFTKMGPAVAAAAAALKLAKDAFKQNKEIMDDWGRVTEEVSSVYKGFLNALNSGDISGFLSNMGKITASARAAFNALEDLGTFNAFNQVNIEKGRTGLASAINDYREGTGSKEAVQKARDYFIEQLEDRKKLENEAYLKAIDKLAAERGVDANLLKQVLSGKYGDFEKIKATPIPSTSYQVYTPAGTSYTKTDYHPETKEQKLAMELNKVTNDELKNLQALGAQAQRTSTEIEQVVKSTNRALGVNRGQKAQERAEKIVTNALENYASIMEVAAIRKKSGLDDEETYKTKELAAHERLFDAYADAYNIYKDQKYKDALDKEAAEILALAEVVKQLKDEKTKNKELTKAENDELRQQKYLDNRILSGLTGKAKKVGWNSEDLGVTGFKTKINEGIDITEDEWKGIEDKLNARLQSMHLDTIKINFETGNIEDVINEIEDSWSKLSKGVGAFSSITGAMDGLKSSAEGLAEAFNGEMDAWDSLMAVFNSGISVLETVIELHESLNTLTELSSALKKANAVAQQEETMQVVTGKGQEIVAENAETIASQVSTGVDTGEATAKAAKSVAGVPLLGPILAVAAIATVLGAIMAARSKGKSGFAFGGIVPGNSFSGDNLHTADYGINSGELVLNRAQQSNLASQLQGSAAQKIEIAGRVRGSDILLAIDNSNSSRGGHRGVYANVR